MLHLRVLDMLKIGQLVLQRGQWQSKRVISEGWIDEILTPHNAGGQPSTFLRPPVVRPSDPNPTTYSDDGNWLRRAIHPRRSGIAPCRCDHPHARTAVFSLRIHAVHCTAGDRAVMALGLG